MSTSNPRSHRHRIGHAIVLAIFLVLKITSVHAANRSAEQRLSEFLTDRYQDGQRLTRGPRKLESPPIPEDQSCVELYRRRIELIGETDDYKPAYWNDPRNQAAVFIGTIWTPAFYFLGYSPVTAHLDELNDNDPRSHLTPLRRTSARQRCFER